MGAACATSVQLHKRTATSRKSRGQAHAFSTSLGEFARWHVDCFLFYQSTKTAVRQIALATVSPDPATRPMPTHRGRLAQSSRRKFHDGLRFLFSDWIRSEDRMRMTHQSKAPKQEYRRA